MDPLTVLVALASSGTFLLALWLLFRRPPAPEADPSLRDRLAAQDAEVASLRTAKGRAEQQLAAAQERANRVEGLEAARDALAQRLEAALRDHADADQRRVAELATCREALAQQARQGAENLRLLEDARQRLSDQFKVLAEEVMLRHGEAFKQANREQIDVLLGPLREQLATFQAGLQLAHSESAKDRERLGEQIRLLVTQSASMAGETRHLTQALKGKSQAQGAWGELVLSRILEGSGLREGEEYVTQESHTAADGSRLRPDVVVNLPNGQRIVIDSKVSLTAFTELVAETDDTKRAPLLDRHVTSMRQHIKGLSAKSYQAVAGSSLDYVIMFVPIEGALAAGLDADPALTAFAAECNVAIGTPTTLMIALRTVASVWQVERRNKNAEAIADRAGKLFDKFSGFVTDLQALGAQLDKSRHTFDAALAKLSTGPGNLVRQVDQLRALGAKATRPLPPELVEGATGLD